MALPRPLFDERLHRLRLDRAARRFGEADFLKNWAVKDLIARLESVNRRFATAVDLGARTGTFAEALASSPLSGRIDLLLQSDLSLAMLERAHGLRLVADEARPPFAEHSLDLVVSTLALHWIDDLVGALIQVRRALKPDGLFLGALLGGATLTELRQCLMAAETEIVGGAGPRVSPFLDAADGGMLLQRAGFALPVVDMETVTVRYPSPAALICDLRRMGETNVLIDRPMTSLTRAVRQRVWALYDEWFGQADGRIPATFEIITLTGWAPHPEQPRPLPRGSAKMRLADALHPRRPTAEGD